MQSERNSTAAHYGLVALILCVLIGFVALNYENLAPDRFFEWAGESFASMGVGKGIPMLSTPPRCAGLKR